MTPTSRALHLDELDRKLLICLQEDFPLCLRPFRQLGKRLSLDEDEVISRVKRLKSRGIIKRIGPIHNSEKIGYKRTLVGMPVPKSKLNLVAGIVNGFSEVTHNYLRKDSRFNLWFTLICPTYARINSIIKTVKRESGINEIISLPTVRTIKIKTVFKV
jgi:DNA-binding Lrp family transcriptional regulator